MKEDCKKERRLILEWMCVILIAIIMLCTFSYLDFRSLTIWSTNFWDVIAEGDITQYFAYTAKNIYGAPHQYVSGTLYSLIPWAIWNLPIWIAQHYFNLPILITPVSLLWSSLFLVLCCVGVIFLTKKITFEITKDSSSSKLAMFLTFSSIWMYIGVFMAGQNDIMICLLGLLSVYALVKKKTKLFLLAAGFAISVKYFFLFPFVALVLLTEKNIYRIVKKIGIGLLPTLFFQLICRGLPMFLESSQSGPITEMLGDLFKIGIPGFGGVTISLFVIAMLFVYIISYITIPKEEEYSQFVIYTTVIGIAPMILFTKIQFYRAILIIPFLTILLLQNRKILKLNLLLEIVMEIGSFIVILLLSTYIFSPKYAAVGIIPSIFQLDMTEMALGQKLIKVFPDIKAILPVFSAMAVFGMITLVIINHPRFKDKYIEYKDEKIERWILWIRPLIVAGCTAAMYYTMI